MLISLSHLLNSWCRYYDDADTAQKVSKYGVISGLYFPAFGLNAERYFVSPRMQSECGKMRTRNNSVFGHFSRSVILSRYHFYDSDITSKYSKLNLKSYCWNIFLFDKIIFFGIVFLLYFLELSWPSQFNKP